MQPTLASLVIASRDGALLDGSAALRQPANRADPHMPPAMTQPGSRLGGSNLVASHPRCALEELHQLLAVGGTPAGNGIVSGAGLKPSHRCGRVVALRDIGAGDGAERLSVRLGRRLIK
jgi:hypothetical protein